MIIYTETIGNFINHCEQNTIADEMSQCMRNSGIGYFDDSQVNAWRASLPEMAKILAQTRIPQDAIIAAEYKIQQARERLDFVITGKNANQESVIIIVELKQWSRAESSTKDNYVRAFGGGGHKDYWHPSCQALNYANIIADTYLYPQENNIKILACAYLHNMPQQFGILLKDSSIYPFVENAPVFLADDKEDFVQYLNDKIVASDHDLLVQLDSSRIVPSRHLSDMLVQALNGNDFFHYDEGQATSVATIVDEVRGFLHYNEKRVVIIKGGPGTGKSVVALNALGILTKPSRENRTGYNAAYYSVNAAPRNLYSEELIQNDYTRAQLKNFFKYPTVFVNCGENAIDCALIDEAHRVFDFKGGVGITRDAHVLRRAVAASKVSVFFIDEDQAVTKDDYATIERIRDAAEACRARVIEGPDLQLTTQFRVLGGDDYISFIKSFLGYNNERPHYRPNINYEFKVCDTACEVRDWVRAHDQETRQRKSQETGNRMDCVSGKCRIVAGYCYNWVSKGEFRDGPSYDIILDGGSFRAKWNLKCAQTPADYSWLNDPQSVDEIGCIHTCQGLDIDYCGVIIGKDIVYRNGNIVFNKQQNAKTDRASGIRNADDNLAETLIRNTYNVLLTRGIKGTYVYCEDPALREHLKSLVN